MLLLHYRHQGVTSAPPVVLLHGLFGDLDNLGALASDSGQPPSFRSTLPNHGASPQSADMHWATMCQQLLALLDHQGWEQVSLVGHSLGGKLATVLRYPQRVTHLVVVDIAPVRWRTASS